MTLCTPVSQAPHTTAITEANPNKEFYRAQGSGAARVRGAGLGLTIATQIAHDHGGHIRYSPNSGKGSSFTLCIPLTKEAE
jgi:signal transduction histidine kinase